MSFTKVGTIYRQTCGCVIAESSHGELFYLPDSLEFLHWNCPEHTPEKMMARQQEYDRLVDYFGVPDDRASMEAFSLHERIVRILDGIEPDPSKLVGVKS